MTDQFTSGSLYENEPAPPAPTASPTARWEDYMDIFYAPASVFARRATSGFGLPMLVVTVLLAALFFANRGVLQPVMDGEFARQSAAMMRKNPAITAEQLAKGRDIGEKFGAIFIVLGTPVAIFFTGIALWLVGKIFEARQTLAAALMVASYAFLPKVLASIAAGVQGMFMDSASMNGAYRVSLGVGRFFDPDVASAMLLAIVGRLDVFTIWITVLLAIGLSVTGGISRGKAALAAAIVWCLGALPGVLGALSR